MIPELQFCSQTNNDTGLHPGDYKWEPMRQQSDLTHGSDAMPGAFSQMELCTWDFPALLSLDVGKSNLVRYVLLLSSAVSISCFLLMYYMKVD